MRFSLKFKILFGISTLLLICTFLSLGYSYNLFIKDKTSYIFETGLKKAEIISDQLYFKINDLTARNAINAILLSNANVNFDNIINAQEEIIIAGSLVIKEAKSSLSKEFSNTKVMNKLSSSRGVHLQDFTNEVLEKSNNLTQIPKNGTWIFSPRPNLNYLVHISQKPINNQLFFSISDITPLFELFYKDRHYSNKIISLSNSKDRAANSELISKINYSTSRKGSLETKLNNLETLLSYTLINNQILIICSITKADAFGITNFLILKTVFFAFFLLGLAISAGIYFSSSITYPITKLTLNAKQIAEGDFSSEVKIETSDEIKILGDTFNFMSSEIKDLLRNKEQLIAQLEDYSKNLEQMVEQRTLELKEANDFMALMVNSLDQGLLVFDEELNCHPMFTKACEPIFGISPLGKRLPEILGQTDEENIQELKQWSTLLFKEMLPFESGIELGPREKMTGTSFNDPDFKHVQIDYYPMRDSEKKISNIVLIATDKTNEMQAIELAKEKEAYVSMILKILNNKTQFESFIGEVEDIFLQFKDILANNSPKIDIELAAMLFHTLNGGFGIYNISKLQAMSRSFENELSEFKESPSDKIRLKQKIERNVKNLKEQFFNFRVELDSLIGTKFATNQISTEISKEKILELKKLVLKTGSMDLEKFINEHFLKTPIINYFKAYDDFCKVTAVKINKNFSGVIFNNAELKIEAEKFLEFFNVLVHLFRNCLDHGLEDAYQRQSLGKNPEGHIAISFDEIKAEKDSLLSIVIQDDGAGIDPEQIRARYTQLNPGIDITSLSDKEVLYKIFDPYFSTRDEVSALSGRGVGMSAIKEVVDGLNGQIEIESQVGVGTIFSFLIPIS